MPQKIRELLNALRNAGFAESGGAGKGSHRKFTHPDYPGAVTISGKSGDDENGIKKNKLLTQLKL